MRTKNCKQCNKEFNKTANVCVKEWLVRAYCSKDCYTLSMKGKDLFTDKTRNTVAWNKGVPGPKGEESPNWKGGEVTLVCRECSTHFKAKSYRKNTAQFCSRICKTNNSDKGKTPANQKIRQSAAYKSWRTLVFERDNYICQHCEVRGTYLHADHIKPFALYPELRLEPSNGRTLCVPCHKKTGTWGHRKDLIALAQEA